MIASKLQYTIDGAIEHSPAVWTSVSAWWMLLPLLYNCVNGELELKSGNIKFRYTAMQSDSLLHRVSILIFICGIAWLALRHFRLLIHSIRKHVLLCALPVLAIASAAWASHPSHAFLSAISLLLQTVFAFYMCRSLPSGRLIEMIVFTGFIALLLSSLVLFIPGIGIDCFQENAWRGIFGQRNNCGAACVWFVLSAAHYKPLGLIQKIIRLIVCMLGIVFIVMSGSRTAWELSCAAIVLCLLTTLWRRCSHLDAIILLYTSIPLLFGMLGCLYLCGPQLLLLIGKDPTLTGRSVLWVASLQASLHHPLVGYGFASFWNGLSGESADAVLTTGWMEGQAQNGFIDLMLQLGSLGVAIFTSITCLALLRSASSLRRQQVDFYEQRWVCVTIILILIYNVGESAIAKAFNITWLLYLIAVIRAGASTSFISLPTFSKSCLHPRQLFAERIAI